MTSFHSKSRARRDPDRAVATWLWLKPRVLDGSEKTAQLTTP
jgi:hypothetical protein